jgi:hypothetical protein
MSLPPDMFLILFHELSFNQVVASSRTCKYMLCVARYFLQHVDILDDGIPVTAIDYVIRHCQRLRLIPHISGKSKLELSSLLKLQKRWPLEMYLNWDMTTPMVISTFLKGVTVNMFRCVQHLGLKVVDVAAFQATGSNFHYLDLHSLAVDAEGCSLPQILMGLNCRSWDVDSVYLRGDISNLSLLLKYAPDAYDSITLINTMDTTHCRKIDLEDGLRCLCISDCRSISLCNIFKFCCTPASVCSIVDLFLDTIGKTMTTLTKACSWKVDRLQVDMIEALLQNGRSVQCGVFAAEKASVVNLEQNFLGQLQVTSFI